jgi:hypothetical protein
LCLGRAFAAIVERITAHAEAIDTGTPASPSPKPCRPEIA